MHSVSTYVGWYSHLIVLMYHDDILTFKVCSRTSLSLTSFFLRCALSFRKEIADTFEYVITAVADVWLTNRARSLTQNHVLFVLPTTLSCHYYYGRCYAVNRWSSRVDELEFHGGSSLILGWNASHSHVWDRIAQRRSRRTWVDCPSER